jgi:hypothetical protein
LARTILLCSWMRTMLKPVVTGAPLVLEPVLLEAQGLTPFVDYNCCPMLFQRICLS